MLGLRVSTQPRWGGFRPTSRDDLGHRETSLRGPVSSDTSAPHASVGKS
jgi:hypothetical protein